MRPAAVFDMDGTLIRGDSLLPFLSRVAGPVAVARALTSAFATSSGRAAAKAVVVDRLLSGRSRADIDEIAEPFTQVLLRKVRRDCRQRWRWHQDRGDTVVLASASLDIYLEPLGRLLGADAVVCTRVETVDGVLTGRLATPNCAGHEKVRRVEAQLGGRPTWAYADGSVDRPLRTWAEHGVRVRPWRLDQRPLRASP